MAKATTKRALCLLLLATLAVPAGAGRELAVAGITKPFKAETLSSTVPGTVMKINVEEGDRIEVDQVLLELDRRMEELEVARRKLMWESRAEVDSAEARVATLKMELEGTRKVFETTRSVSREELEQKELEHKLAEADLLRFEIAEEREKIEYEMALEQLRRRSLAAPVAGIINKIHVEEGENCEPRQPLIHLVDTSKCYFIANVEASITPHLTVGQEVSLRVGAGPWEVTRTGTISFVAPVVDAASDLQEIKVVFENADQAVRPGVAGVMTIVVPDGD